MKIAYHFIVKGGKYALLNDKADGIVSIGPNGREPDRPLDAPIGPYEDCGLPAAVLVYHPTDSCAFAVIPE